MGINMSMEYLIPLIIVAFVVGVVTLVSWALAGKDE
jgi:nitrogen fixation-related uncharacterized protein